MIVEGLLSGAQKSLNATQTKEINLLGAGTPDSRVSIVSLLYEERH